jgi:hypothetical protein
MISSSTPTHYETALITVGIGGTERISPASGEAPVDAANQTASIKPLTSIALGLIKGGVQAQQIIWNQQTYIFLQQTNKTVARSHPTNNIELTPSRMTLGRR